MSRAEGSEPAFPDGMGVTYYGLTKREEMAARAMQGMCSFGTWPDRNDCLEIARCAVFMADALISELNASPSVGTGGTG